MTFLKEKPIWIHWIFFVVLSGLIFGITSAAVYLLTLRWWVAVLGILAAGITWGTIVFKKAAPEK